MSKFVTPPKSTWMELENHLTSPDSFIKAFKRISETVSSSGDFEFEDEVDEDIVDADNEKGNDDYEVSSIQGDVESDVESNAEIEDGNEDQEDQENEDVIADKTPPAGFYSTVHRMRAMHPDIKNNKRMSHDQTLDRKAGTWRTDLESLLDKSIPNKKEHVSSNMGIHKTVAALSQRCFKEADGVMLQWMEGKFPGQTSTSVTQYLFAELKGVAEEDAYNILFSFNQREIDQFDFKRRCQDARRNRKMAAQGPSGTQREEAEVRQRKEEELRQRMEEELTQSKKKEEELLAKLKQQDAQVETLKKKMASLEKERDVLKKQVSALQRQSAPTPTASKRPQSAATPPAPESASTSPATKRRRSSDSASSRSAPKALNWEGKEVRQGQLVAVTFSHPRTFYVGQVVQVGEEKTDEGVEVEVQFYKDKKKFGVPEKTMSKYVIETEVEMARDELSQTFLPITKKEKQRLKGKDKEFWSVKV
ncbi:uncharacterized protein [Branchiostoma lanceolatum]|uniref:uncharacterized protein n=1 Tax=Branchiostoma lanceolatum TaxID=7740 RepID=UPI00345509A3